MFYFHSHRRKGRDGAGNLRALYEEDEVVILIVGRKVGNKLIVAGKEFHAHEDDSEASPRKAFGSG